MLSIYIIIICICAFSAIVLMCVVVYRMKQITSQSKQINTRLKFWLSEKSASGKYSPEEIEKRRKESEETFTKRVLIPLGEQVGTWMSEKVPYSRQSALRKLLIRAGFRDRKALHFFYAVKIICTTTIIGLVLFISTISPKGLPGGFAIPVLVAYFSFQFPNFYMNKRAAKRKSNINKVLPDALDLLVICTEAGMGIDQSLLRVAANLGANGKDLAEEIIITNREINLGLDRNVCWNNLGERADSDELKNLSRIINQSEKVGSSISNVLRTQSDFLRVKRRQKAEEIAAKMAIKMMIPMAIFIFPCILAIAMGPPIVKIIGTFSK